MRIGRHTRWLGVGAACALLAGCAAGPRFVRPRAPTGTAYAAESGATPGAPALAWGTDVPAGWWRQFGSPSLDSTLATTLAENQSLRSAMDALRQTEDLRRAGYGLLVPQVSVNGGAARQRTQPVIGGAFGASSLYNLFTLSGSVGYVLDLFGGARRRLEELGAKVDLAEANARAAYLALTANTVNAVIARSAFEAQLEAANESLSAAREDLRLTEANVTSGVAPYSAVLTAQATVAALEQAQAGIEQHRDAATHLLASLAGRPAGEWSPEHVAFDSLHEPQQLPVLLPSALVRQRPDIQATEATLHAASAEVGVATADMLPTVTIAGSRGSEALTPGGLGKASGSIWTAGGEVSIPVFQGGALLNARRAAVDAYDAALADYRQTVLNAFEQVADTLQAIRHDTISLSSAKDAERAAADAHAIATANFNAGVVGYTSVAQAIEALQTARIARIGAAAQQMQDAVALYVALGGDWKDAPPLVSRRQ